jgi:hypothetical protein
MDHDININLNNSNLKTTQYSNISFFNMSNIEDFPVVNFKNEKEFNQEIEIFLNLTKNLSADWKKRENALKRMAGIFKGNYSENPEFVKLLNSKIYLNLYNQMADLRSSLMKEACKVMVLCAQIYKNNFEAIADKLFHANYLYKLLSSQNKIISESVHNCMMGILSNIQSGKILIKIFDQHKSKANIIRARICQQMLFCLSNYDPECLIKYYDVVEACIVKMSPDASSEVRVQARRIFFKYIELNPYAEEELLSILEHNVVKQIKEDKKKIDEGTYEYGEIILNSVNRSFASFNTNDQI